MDSSGFTKKFSPQGGFWRRFAGSKVKGPAILLGLGPWWITRTEGSISQELCHFVNINVRCLLLYIQCILCESSSYSFQYIILIHCSYLSDILKMCMKIFLGEKKIFLTILQRFEFSQLFSFTLHIEHWHIVPTLCN